MEVAANAAALFILAAEQVERQFAQRTLGFVQTVFHLSALAEIACNFAEAKQFAVMVVNRGNGDARPETRAVFADAPAFLLNPAVLSCLREHVLRFMDPTVCFGVETREMAADDFLGRVTLDALRAAIPAGYIALGIEHEDGVVLDSINQQPELLSLFAFRFVRQSRHVAT